MTMQLTLDPNPLYREQQVLEVDKVATLIGENGSGKSCILQSIFDKKLAKTDLHHLKVVCFSSGQNENFSQYFSSYLSRQRRANSTLNLDCFYYDKSWSKLLIFLSTCLYDNGLVRRFLREHGYVEENQSISGSRSEDISSTLLFKFKVDKAYAERVKDALEQERLGEMSALRSSPYFRSLSSFITCVIDREYAFEDRLKKSAYRLDSGKLFSVSYESRQISAETEEAGDLPVTLISNPTVSFFTQAADKDYFIDKKQLALAFKGGLEMDYLSDGEYQLLFLYSLIDLFDSPDTLFLLDEADSHLHYQNIDRLWKVLGGIKGKAITTTHLLDSITANDFHALKVVERGRISDRDKLKQLIERLKVLSRASTVEFEICAKLRHMALLDDYNDWHIFVRLAERKGLDVERLHSIQAFKKTSSYRATSESFGKAKILWTEGLSKVESEFLTAQIFLICDRDEAPIEFDRSGVKVCGQTYRDQINAIRWPNNARVNVHLLAWKRREIKNYLLSHAVLSHHGVLDQVNSNELAVANHLQAGVPGDNDGIRNLNVKPVIDPLINEDGIGLSLDKLQAYIALMPPEEISEDIENMCHYIVSKL